MKGLKLDIPTPQETSLATCRKYYGILFLVNNISISPMELELLCYCVLYGTISTPPTREEFLTNTSIKKASMYNLIARLQKKKLLIKGIDKKIRINPSLKINLKDINYITLNISMKIV